MIHRLVASLLIPVTLACTTMGPVANPREFIPIKRPNAVWLTQRDGKVLVMYRPIFEGDTLFGVVRGQGQRKVPRSEITDVQAMVPAPDRTRLVLMGSSALAIAGLFWAARNASPFPPPFGAFCQADPDDC
jgi:hypothetical protein